MHRKSFDGERTYLPPAGFWIPLAQIATVYYFFHFLILLPILGKIERPLPLPPSIADAVLKKKAA